MKKLFTLTFLSIAFSTLNAQDTFSIVAVDSSTGQVGSAGASCIVIPGEGVRLISDVHPGGPCG